MFTAAKRGSGAARPRSEFTQPPFPRVKIPSWAATLLEDLINPLEVLRVEAQRIWAREVAHVLGVPRPDEHRGHAWPPQHPCGRDVGDRGVVLLSHEAQLLQEDLEPGPAAALADEGGVLVLAVGVLPHVPGLYAEVPH